MQELIPVADGDMVRRLTDAGVPALIAERLAAQAPHADLDALGTASDRVVRSLTDTELRAILEAVPEPDVQNADAGTLEAAHLALRMYRDRFGYPFVSGIETPTAEELLMRVRIRLGNEPLPEWRAAREHVRRLCRARLLRALRPAGGA